MAPFESIVDRSVADRPLPRLLCKAMFIAIALHGWVFVLVAAYWQGQHSCVPLLLVGLSMVAVLSLLITAMSTVADESSLYKATYPATMTRAQQSMAAWKQVRKMIKQTRQMRAPPTHTLSSHPCLLTTTLYTAHKAYKANKRSIQYLIIV